MKRILILSIVIIMIVLLCGNVCFAEHSESVVYDYGAYTVEVSGVLFDEGEAQEIADGMCIASVSVPSYLSAKSATCTSHTFKQYTTTVTEHFYYSTAPFCISRLYKVVICTNSGCDYMEKTLLSGTRVNCCAAKIFKDVGYGEWYSRAVLLMKQRGIMLGTDGYFNPKDNVTRGEFVMILARFAGADLDKYTKSSFTDAPITAWYGKAVAWAKSNKIVDGYSPKYFGPNDPITREQMCVMLKRYENKIVLELSFGEGREFSDKNEISPWAVDAVNKCSAWGIVNGMEDGSFRPRENTTRAQSAQLMYNLIHKAGLAYNNAFKEAGNNDYSGGASVNSSGGIWGEVSTRYPFLDDKTYYSLEDLAFRLNMSHSVIYEDYTVYEHTYFARYFDTTVMTDEEFMNGITASYYRMISERGALLFPRLNGVDASFSGGRTKIELNHYDILKRTSISYELEELGTVDIIDMPAEILDAYKDATITELLSALDSNILSVRSYADATVDYFCEREFTLADRTVTAFVSRYCGDSEGYMHIWFVYDGAIIRMYGHENTIEETLKTLSFCEMAL